MSVPNKFPTAKSNGIAIIGEAPGANEERLGEPFVGYSGRLLNGLMSRAGISRASCFVGNICQERPPGNDITAFRWDDEEIQEGLEQLEHDLNEVNPNVCLLLGNAPLKAALDPNGVGKYKHPVSSWRGSVVMSEKESAFRGRKIIGSYHPAACLRQYEWTPVLGLDLKRAASEADTPSIIRIQREAILPTDVASVLNELEEVKRNKELVALDIEGGIGTMSCISFAQSADRAFLVPLAKLDGANYWEDEEDEMLVWRALSDVLSDPEIPKILQNSLYDRFVLQYSYGIPVRGVVEDTMLKHWELYCELEKSLAFQTSIYTSEPYYKFERKSGDRETLYKYCCKDSMLTYEISRFLEPHLRDRSREHYRFNVSLLNPLLYMELRGIKYDQEKAWDRSSQLQRNMWAQQHQLNELAQCSLEERPKHEILSLARSILCYKKDPTRAKKGNEDKVATVETYLSQSEGLADFEWGEMENAMGVSRNVESPKFINYLYDELKLPIQTNRDGGRTADYEALLNLKKKTEEGSVKRLVIEKAIEIRSLGTRSRMLRIRSDRDGRIRCGYNIVGTETGRLTSYTSPTGSGYNLQTIPAYDRDLFVADEDHWFFQCDLSGADGWTVAAHCKALGDPTMFDDLSCGIKPAKVAALGLRYGAEVLRLPREELRERSGEVKKEDWDYFACKIAQHGTCYLMGLLKLAKTIFKESDGRVQLSKGEVQAIQNLFLVRYNVRKWHDHTGRKLAQSPVIVSASGHRRVFFGRYNEILGDALAHEPQANTTYATNLAVGRLWNDPTNRRDDGSLIVEPLHQVHDALCGQFRKQDTEFAVRKIREWFDNTLVIAGQAVKIPFEGGYGNSWGKLEHVI